MTIIGVISDTHGLLRNTAHDALQGVDLIIHAGDVGSSEILRVLREIAPVYAVRGNMDGGKLGVSLFPTEVVNIENILLYVLHDIGRLDLDPAAAGFAAVIYGHSHKPALNEKNGIIYLNPGSAGPKRFDNPVTLALMELKGSAENFNISTRFINLEE
ncbi:MAG: metallophosphoesterase family protein [Desulfobacterales bacterium]